MLRYTYNNCAKVLDCADLHDLINTHIRQNKNKGVIELFFLSLDLSEPEKMELAQALYEKDLYDLSIKVNDSTDISFYIKKYPEIKDVYYPLCKSLCVVNNSNYVKADSTFMLKSKDFDIRYTLSSICNLLKLKFLEDYAVLQIYDKLLFYPAARHIDGIDVLKGLLYVFYDNNEVFVGGYDKKTFFMDSLNFVYNNDNLRSSFINIKRLQEGLVTCGFYKLFLNSDDNKLELRD